MRSSFRLMILSALVALLPATAQAGRLDDLVAALGGHDEPARSLARQLLPREGVAAVPKILPLLGRDDPNVWNAAFQTLSDLANEVSMPGREADRAAVAAHLMAFVVVSTTPDLKERGLRLLPIVVPDTFNLGPVAGLLDDPKLREKARVAFEEAGTTSARAVLRDHLGKSDPAFTAALLNALGRLKDAGSLDAIRPLTDEKNDPVVRVAASRALSWTGDPRDLETAKVVLSHASPADRSEAMDALLRQTIALERTGKNRPLAISTYFWLVSHGQGVAKDAALAGLGRVGDAACVAPVLEVISKAEPPTLFVGIDALRKMPGDDVTKAIVEAYPSLAADLKARMVPALGARKHPAVLPLLEEAASATEKPLRRAGIEALGETGVPDAVGPLVALNGRVHEDDRPVVVNSLLRLGDLLAASGRGDEAGTAFFYALSAVPARLSAQRRHALEGVATHPLADAYTPVKAAAADPALREPAVRALMSVAAALTAANQKAKAIDLYEIVRGMNPSTEVVQELVKGMAAAGSSADLRGLLGTVSRWHVIGPFELGAKHEGWDTVYVGEPDVSMVARFMAGKRRAQWTPVVSAEANGRIDLRKTVGNRDLCVGYAYAEIILDKPTDAVLLLGVDDSERIWVNGKKVFEQFVARGFTPDEDKVPVKLEAGTNKILLKIYQNGMGWEFCVRIVTPDGRPVPFTQKTQ